MFRRTPFTESPFFHPDNILEVKNYFDVVDLEMQEKNTPIHPRLKSRGFLGKMDKSIQVREKFRRESYLSSN